MEGGEGSLEVLQVPLGRQLFLGGGFQTGYAFFALRHATLTLRMDVGAMGADKLIFAV